MSLKIPLVAACIFLALTSTAPALELGFTSFGELDEFDPGSQTITTNGVGSPTVTFNSTVDPARYVLLFHTRLHPDLASFEQGAYDCDHSSGIPLVWGIGRAISSDGTSWTIDDEPVLMPDSNAAYKCSLLDPTLLFDGTTYHVFYVAADTKSEFEGDPASFDRHLFHATSSDGVIFTTNQTNITRPEIADPSVMLLNGVFHLMISIGPGNSFRAYGGTSADGNTWDIDWATPVFDKSAVTWGQHELFSPALTCDEDDPSNRNIQVFVAARADATGSPPTGLGFARSGDFLDPLAWALVNPADDSAPLIHWDDTNCVAEKSLCLTQSEAFRQFDLLRVGDEFVLYAAYPPGGAGFNHLVMFYSTPTSDWPEADVRNRNCTLPEPLNFAEGFEGVALRSGFPSRW